jgi:pyruvate/2-oxoglutarate dehydrogenase complex dihydrolipoamide acyltransferase (E2) component
MITEVCVPKTATAGTKLSIGRWFKRAGDPVSLDEPLVEINTDDLTCEVRAPATGVLSMILVTDGESVAPGAVLGNISQF